MIVPPRTPFERRAHVASGPGISAARDDAIYHHPVASVAHQNAALPRRRLGLRIFVACLIVVGLYSVLRVAQVAGYLDERTLAVIWLAVAGMGSAFLVLLVLLYYSSRLQS